MKKIITIIGYSEKSINPIAEQIKDIFENNVLIKKYTDKDLEHNNKIISDLSLFSSYELYDKNRACFEVESNILIMNRTILKEGFNRIKNISTENDIYLVDETRNMAEEICGVICQLGIKSLNIKPLSKDENPISNSIVINLEENNNKDNKIVNIGHALLDINTIIEIGIRLDLDQILQTIDLEKSYKEIITSQIGLALILNKANRFDSQIKVLLNSTDDGIIEFDINRKAVLFNKKALDILGQNEENVLTLNACELIKNISFNTVYNGKKTIKDELLKVNDRDIITSIYPLINSGKFYGAVAIIKEFNEVEKKQHKLRKKLAGKGHRAKYTFDDIIGNSNVIKECKTIAKRMAKSNSSVLITGETGTGKELFAQAIHNTSLRKEYQFVTVNCGALPANILESELFGYEEGAFTGARKGGKPGLFELAHKGTIFLDEIGEMPINLQMKLLRVLQEREIMRLGSDSVIDVDIRVIAATNKNLEALIAEGKFREDLFYRLNVLPLKIPPLRKRVEDILGIFEYFKRKYRGKFILTDEAEELLLRYNWKGNIRELKNYVEYLVNIEKDLIEVKDIPINSLKSLSKQYILKNNKDNTIEEFISFAGKYIDIYVYVLKVLQKSLYNNSRMGRRSILKEAQIDNVFVSEQEIRRILSELEKYSLVRINKGRGGSVITELGTRVLKILEK